MRRKRYAKKEHCNCGCNNCGTTDNNKVDKSPYYSFDVRGTTGVFRPAAGVTGLEGRQYHRSPSPLDADSLLDVGSNNY